MKSSASIELGVFDIFWNKYPNHLPFLNLVESRSDPKEFKKKHFKVIRDS